MGRTLLEAVLNDSELRLAVALEQADHPALGRDAGELAGIACGVRISADFAQALADADALIDFTRPEGTLAHLRACVQHGVRAVIGTTGFDAAGRAAIQSAAERIAIVFAPNMSIGVNATLKLLEVVSRMLDEDWDVEIVEAHHQHKVDAPSGTALKMGEVVAQARGKKFSDIAVLSREGQTGERRRGTIGFAALRGGDIVGDHTVMFCGAGERIEITHKSASRQGYAAGSLRAARFLADKRSGLFDMFDVLGLA
jgi:4-hydroxy-tetrahydrodipicolinate reductase